MSLSEYFEDVEGLGILATADSEGNVDLAIYARPHMVDDETLAFVMAQKTSYTNVQSNPKAAYMFVEKTAGYKGKRLYLSKKSEEADPEIGVELARRDVKLMQGAPGQRESAIAGNYSVGMWWASLSTQAKVWTVVGVVVTLGITAAALDDEDDASPID